MCTQQRKSEQNKMSTTAGTDSVREKILTDYRKKLLEHKELEAKLKESKFGWTGVLICLAGRVTLILPLYLTYDGVAYFALSYIDS